MHGEGHSLIDVSENPAAHGIITPEGPVLLFLLPQVQIRKQSLPLTVVVIVVPTMTTNNPAFLGTLGYRQYATPLAKAGCAFLQWGTAGGVAATRPGDGPV